MQTRIALVALGRSSLPTGKAVLTGELADGVTIAAVEGALAKGDVEFEALPDLPQTVVGPAALEPVRQTTVLPPPATRPNVNTGDPLAGKSPAEIRSELDQARRADARKRDEAAKAVKAKAVKEVLKGRSHPDLLKLAKKEKVTFSARGSKEEIATEIVEARMASS